jgi:CubicO group peptidase (beta-lactamase class C family)
MVHAWGKYDQLADVASIVKPLIVHLILKAHDDGLIADLDGAIADHHPRLVRLNAHLDHKDRHITWRDMMTQRSGYGVSEPPGEAFDYSDIQMALLWDTLIHKVHEATFAQATEDLLRRELTNPIGCQDAPFFTEAGRLRISARDLARLGWLYLARGTWNGRRLLSGQSITLVLESPHPPELPRTKGQPAAVLPGQRSLGGGYNIEDHLNSSSYCWWLNGVTDSGERVLPGAPADTFGAFGHGGRHALIVIPSRRLVVAWVTGLGQPPPRLFSVDGRRRVDAVLSKALAAAPQPRAP